jgi:hypothetical protein
LRFGVYAVQEFADASAQGLQFIHGCRKRISREICRDAVNLGQDSGLLFPGDQAPTAGLVQKQKVLVILETLA